MTVTPQLLSSSDRPVIIKAWGAEEVLINRPEYCAKLLWISPGWECSLHYHDVKTESFFAFSGDIQVEYHTPDGELHNVILCAATRDGLHIPPGTPHRFHSLTDTAVLLEVSTTHADSDVTRLVESRPRTSDAPPGSYDHDTFE